MNITKYIVLQHLKTLKSKSLSHLQLNTFRFNTSIIQSSLMNTVKKTDL